MKAEHAGKSSVFLEFRQLDGTSRRGRRRPGLTAQTCWQQRKERERSRSRTTKSTGALAPLIPESIGRRRAILGHRLCWFSARAYTLFS